MNDPSTRLDERFSDPETRPTSWSAARAALEAAELFWISTVRADGRPHVTPLVAVWLDDALHFCTGPGEQKALILNLVLAQAARLARGPDAPETDQPHLVPRRPRPAGRGDARHAPARPTDARRDRGRRARR